jgi:HEAT repeat protein
LKGRRGGEQVIMEFTGQKKFEEDEERIKSTKALVQTFLQTVRAYRLYESNHPILTKFLDRLRNDFDHYFDQFNSFSLQVGEYRLFYHGKVVYESEDLKDSLAFFFYKDGIREIRFYSGLEMGEIVDFLNIVRRGDTVNRLEDDLVTLLWEKDFQHIDFTSVDEFLEGGTSFVPEAKGDSTVDSTKESERESAQEETVPPLPRQPLVQACQLDADEIEEIDREVQQEQQPEYAYTLIDNLIEIMLHLGEDADAYENMISYFERMIVSSLEQKEIEKAATLLKRLSATMESMGLKDKQILAIRRILESSSNSRSVELLGEIMKNDGAVDSESILGYLQFLTKQAIDPLCLLLGKLESSQWRRVICDLLIELSREDIQPFSKFLSNRNPFLICHILYILGEIKHPSTVKYLADLVTHEDLKVREETLKVLTVFRKDGKDLLQRFLKDPSPRNRSKASLVLAKTARGEAAKPLMEIIFAPDFYRRDYEEKASFLQALAETGAEEGVEVLKKIATKKRWFQKAKWGEMRLCATHTLKKYFPRAL